MIADLFGFFSRGDGEDALCSVGEGRDHRRRGTENIYDDDDALGAMIEGIKFGGRTEINVHRG